MNLVCNAATCGGVEHRCWPPAGIDQKCLRDPLRAPPAESHATADRCRDVRIASSYADSPGTLEGHRGSQSVCPTASPTQRRQNHVAAQANLAQALHKMAVHVGDKTLVTVTRDLMGLERRRRWRGRQVESGNYPTVAFPSFSPRMTEP